MKKYVGNGYYYLNTLGYFSINKSNKQKMCLNDGNCINDKEMLKNLFRKSLIEDLSNKEINYFACITHDSFIDIIEHSGFEVKAKISLPYSGNIKELFQFWKCEACENCRHKSKCFVCLGSLPDEKRKEYIVVFKRNSK